jgi:hypothetical protein
MHLLVMPQCPLPLPSIEIESAVKVNDQNGLLQGIEIRRKEIAFARYRKNRLKWPIPIRTATGNPKIKKGTVSEIVIEIVSGIENEIDAIDPQHVRNAEKAEVEVENAVVKRMTIGIRDLVVSLVY